MSHAEEPLTRDDEGPARKGTPSGHLLVRVALSMLFLLSTLPSGLFWLGILAALVLVGLPLSIIWVGLPILVLAMAVCVLGTDIERWRLRALLGTRVTSPLRPQPRGSARARLRARVGDPALWRGLLYLVLLVPIGAVEFVVVLALGILAMLASYPLWFWTQPEGSAVMWTGAFVADTLPEALLVMLVGLVLASATLVFVAQAAQLHASLGRVLLGPRKRDERVEELTEGRTKAVEAAITERRRIERDLHDGAQQRLVSLAMTLGMARQKLEKGANGGKNGSPDALRAASQLVGEAHEEAKRALAEIRDLIRGIHPAVLADRGLDAAVSALAGRSPVPTSVDVDLAERPSDAAEITAYFVIAEALANVAKHSGASEAHVLARRETGAPNGGRPGDLLVVEVVDDGRGGADPAGAGLRGLADRTLVLDGRLTVESPAGGPTRVRAELPWGDPKIGRDDG